VLEFPFHLVVLANQVFEKRNAAAGCGTGQAERLSPFPLRLDPLAFLYYFK
jgi:hypothetical protein